MYPECNHGLLSMLLKQHAYLVTLSSLLHTLQSQFGWWNCRAVTESVPSNLSAICAFNPPNCFTPSSFPGHCVRYKQWNRLIWTYSWRPNTSVSDISTCADLMSWMLFTMYRMPNAFHIRLKQIQMSKLKMQYDNKKKT